MQLPRTLLIHPSTWATALPLIAAAAGQTSILLLAWQWLPATASVSPELAAPPVATVDSGLGINIFLVLFFSLFCSCFLWWLTGRSLRQIKHQQQAISALQLHHDGSLALYFAAPAEPKNNASPQLPVRVFVQQGATVHPLLVVINVAADDQDNARRLAEYLTATKPGEHTNSRQQNRAAWRLTLWRDALAHDDFRALCVFLRHRATTIKDAAPY